MKEMKKILKGQNILGLVALGSAIAFPAWTAQLVYPQAENGHATDSTEGHFVRPFPPELAPHLLKIAQDIPDPDNMERFRRVMEYAQAQQLYQRPMGEIIQAIALKFLGTPYAAGLLDKSDREQLIISLDGFDCVLFIETVLAIARGVSVQDYSYLTFGDRLLDQRYRNGQLNGYCSRLHYFSDWIADNQNRGIVENITPKLGGIPLNKKLNFMSQHRSSYPQLANDDTNYQCIVNTENQLDKLTINYIPKNQIHTLYNRLQPGDIVATTADIEGLDVTHTGLVYRNSDGSIGFIHASPSGEVKISRDLQTYIEDVEGMTGIILARPNDKRQMGMQPQ